MQVIQWQYVADYVKQIPHFKSVLKIGIPVAAMTGGNKDLEDSLFRSMVRAGGHAGRLYVIEDEKHHILSMALWYPPGSSLFST